MRRMLIGIVLVSAACAGGDQMAEDTAAAVAPAMAPAPAGVIDPATAAGLYAGETLQNDSVVASWSLEAPTDTGATMLEFTNGDPPLPVRRGGVRGDSLLLVVGPYTTPNAPDMPVVNRAVGVFRADGSAEGMWVLAPENDSTSVLASGTWRAQRKP